MAAARKFVRETLQDWLDTRPAPADTELVDDAVLLTSELVTNAVVHAGTQVQVTCKLAASAVEVVVRDSHPARMVPGPARDDSIPAERTSGRGLLLPSALASAWGVSYGAEAKAVWFRMGLAGQRTGLTEPGADPDAAEAAVPVASWSVRAAGASPATAAPPPAEPCYDDLLRQVVGSARVIVAGDAAYALLADEDGDLSVRASTGISPATLLRTAPSVATVPFIADGRVLGVLAVAAVLPGRFGESDVQRLQQLADSLAPALERARLAGLERARRARIDVLAEASALLAARWTRTGSWPWPGRSPYPGWLSGARYWRQARTRSCGCWPPGMPTRARRPAALAAGPGPGQRAVAALGPAWRPAGQPGPGPRGPALATGRCGGGGRARRRSRPGRPRGLVLPAGHPGRRWRPPGAGRPALRAPVAGGAQPR